MSRKTSQDSMESQSSTSINISNPGSEEDEGDAYEGEDEAYEGEDEAYEGDDGAYVDENEDEDEDNESQAKRNEPASSSAGQSTSVVQLKVPYQDSTSFDRIKIIVILTSVKCVKTCISHSILFFHC